MKRAILKFIYTPAALVIFTGALLFCCAFLGATPARTVVNGVEVGGLSRGEAKRVLREREVSRLRGRVLEICAEGEVYRYEYPEIDFCDSFDEGLRAIKRGGEYTLPVRYFLNGAEEIAGYICAEHSAEAVEPSVTFNAEGDPFTYLEGRDGAECDKEALLRDIDGALNCGNGFDGGEEAGGAFPAVEVERRVIPRTGSVEKLRKATEKLCSFTTYFDGGNADRAHNVRLAAAKLNGVVVGAGERFSFNDTVGARTEERGFKPAKIIENGKFVTGVGGGVCQVSTTLYNAVVLSGLTVAEYHPHSLQVSYVPPSRDAMVSGQSCDLKFEAGESPVYIRTSCSLGSVTCTLYGLSDGCEYFIVSETERVVPRPPQVVVEGGEDCVLSYGRDGLESRAYLVVRRGGEETARLLRRDKYGAVADVVQRERSELRSQ